MSYTLKNLYLIGALSFTVAACSHIHVDPIPETADPDIEITKLEVEKSNADSKQLNIYSPENYKKLVSHLSKAQEKRTDNKDNKSILDEVAEGRAYLKRAEAVGHQFQPLLNEVVTARNSAVQSNASEYFKDDFQKVDKRLMNLTTDLESGKNNDINKSSIELKNEYLDLEIRAIRRSALGSTDEIIKQAIDEGAEKEVPRTLTDTRKAVDNLDSLITVDRYNREEIARQAEVTNQLAKRLLTFTRQAKSTKNGSSEELLLQAEAQANRADELERSNNQSEKLVSLQTQINAIQSQFNSREAEIFQENNRVLIRLKGLNFQVGKDYIMNENYPLLNKVQSAIRSLNPKRVVIEGHTDAIGSAAVNKAISSRRAASVKTYLIANRTLPEDKIETIGHGYTKPIANNKTKKGRTENRRVDIVIESASL